MKNIEVIVARPVAVSIKDLTVSDLRSFEKDQLVEISVGLLELLKVQSHTKVTQEVQSPVRSYPVAPKVEKPSIISHPIEDVTESVTDDLEHKKKNSGHHSNNIGVKSGTTSKFHYTSFNKAAKKFPWEASLKIDGKQTSKRFATEVEAAVAVDIQLDFLQDEKRPRNYNEFPEIMEEYKIQQQQEVQ